MTAHHIRLRPRGAWVIADSPEARRVVVRTVLDLGRSRNLLAFGLADNHLHLEAVCDRAEAGKLAHALEVSLGKQLGLRFEQAWIEPVAGGAHLERLFGYIGRQPQHHGLTSDPLSEGTMLHDVLGLRPRGLYVAHNVKRWLPRITRRDLLEMLGVPELSSVDGPLDSLVEAGLRAACLPDLRGKGAERRTLRCALVGLVGRQQSSPALGELLSCSERSVFRLRAATPDRTLVHAVRGQLGLQTARLGRVVSQGDG